MIVTSIEQVSVPTVPELILMAREIEIKINMLNINYVDHAGRINESMSSIALVIDNLENHQKDIDEGKE